MGKITLILTLILNFYVHAEEIEKNAYIQFERSEGMYFMTIFFNGHIYHGHMPEHSKSCPCLTEFGM